MDINFFEIWNAIDDSAGSNPPPVPAGFLSPILGNMILTNATINGTAVTTTDSQVVWYDGE